MCYNVAMETKQTMQIKVYRDNKLSIAETYKPVVKEHLITLGRKIDYWFVNNKWPEATR